MLPPLPPSTNDAPEGLPMESPRPAIYLVCEQKSAGQLAAEVTRLLGQGWRPVGGVAAVPPTTIAESWLYLQAMVRGAS